MFRQNENGADHSWYQERDHHPAGLAHQHPAFRSLHCASYPRGAHAVDLDLVTIECALAIPRHRTRRQRHWRRCRGGYRVSGGPSTTLNAICAHHARAAPRTEIHSLLARDHEERVTDNSLLIDRGTSLTTEEDFLEEDALGSACGRDGLALRTAPR
jgi:hypothetical protein